MRELTPEIISKVKKARNAQELKEIAHEEGFEITELAAENLFQRLHQPDQIIADDELESVAGGGCGESSKKADCSTHMQDGCPTFWNMFG